MNIANKIGSTFVSNASGVCRVVIGDDVEIVLNNTTNSETRSLRQVIEMPPVTDEEPEHVKQRITQYVLEGDLTEEEAQAIAALYPPWTAGEDVAVDDLRSYGVTVYRAIQAHRTQADWTPDATPALWVKAAPENVIPEWVQPAGAHDAYNTGDRVSFEGANYESLIDENVWSPAAYPQGWKKL